MINRIIGRARIILPLIYFLFVLSLYYLAYFEYGFGKEKLTFFLLCVNVVIISPYVLGASIALLSSFSNMKNIIINVICLFVCSYSLILYIDRPEQGWEGVVFLSLSFFQLISILIVVALGYFKRLIIIIDSWEQS
jgi:hypothetical protein|tara:strand:+ start:717 stop:1124 length:408 start_codon:yes stop_codon:yes gene_type:complete